MRFGKGREKYPVRTVEVECIVSDPARASYAIGGRRQRSGDKTRMPYGDALTLQIMNKARILPDTEREEMR
jgi:hypothetical protein